MSQKFTYNKKSINEWIETEPNTNAEALRARATVETVEEAIKEYKNVSVVSAEWKPAHDNWKEVFHVVLKEEGYGTTPATINVYCPLDWNGRYLACTGGGIRTLHLYEILGRENRIVMPFNAVANGFATANTDGGVAGDVFDFGFDEKTGSIDYELILNLAYRSTHTMAVIAKKVITAIYGEAPKFSYMQGASGGGRQSLTEAQIYPDDFDGYWAVDPAINWNEMFITDCWGFIVMTNENHVVAPGKMDVFRKEAVRQNGGRYGFIETSEMPVFDPATCIGMDSKDGPITAEDARVAKLIFDGPKTESGKAIWYGYRPGTHFWSSGALGETGGGCHIKKQDDGSYKAVMNSMCEQIYDSWIMRDKHYDWAQLDYKGLNDFYKESNRVIGCLECNNPDLSAAKACGTKVLLTHAVNDDTIPSDGTVDYYKRVVACMGDEKDVENYLRLFMTPGGDHTGLASPGLSLTMAEGMTTLMKWVEEGVAPETVEGIQYDFYQNAALLKGEVSRYTLDNPSKCLSVEELPAYAKHSDVDPLQKFTVKSTIREIQADEEGNAILNKYAGALLANPAMAGMLDASIGQLQKLMPNKALQENLAKAIEELTQLRYKQRVRVNTVYGSEK